MGTTASSQKTVSFSDLKHHTLSIQAITKPTRCLTGEFTPEVEASARALLEHGKLLHNMQEMTYSIAKDNRFWENRMSDGSVIVIYENHTIFIGQNETQISALRNGISPVGNCMRIDYVDPEHPPVYDGLMPLSDIYTCSTGIYYDNGRLVAELIFSPHRDLV